MLQISAYSGEFIDIPNQIFHTNSSNLGTCWIIIKFSTLTKKNTKLISHNIIERNRSSLNFLSILNQQLITLFVHTKLSFTSNSKQKISRSCSTASHWQLSQPDYQSATLTTFQTLDWQGHGFHKRNRYPNLLSTMTESLVQQLLIACLVVVVDSLVYKLWQAEPSVNDIYLWPKSYFRNHIMKMGPKN